MNAMKFDDIKLIHVLYLWYNQSINQSINHSALLAELSYFNVKHLLYS